MKPLTPKNILGILILVAIIALAMFYVAQNYKEFTSLTLTKDAIYIIPILIILILTNYVLIALIQIALLEPLKVHLDVKEAYMLSLMTGFYNLITPFKGGMAARAVYLKKKHNFPLTQFFAATAASYVVVFLVSSFLGLTSLAMLYFSSNYFSPILTGVFSIVALCFIGLIVFSPTFPDSKNRWISKVVAVANGWHLLSNKPKAILLIAIYTLITLLINTYMFQLVFQVFGFDLSFTHALLITAITNLSLIISITPANLGITEALAVFAGIAVGIDISQSLPPLILHRLVGFITLFILGPICSYYLIKRPNETHQR